MQPRNLSGSKVLILRAGRVLVILRHAGKVRSPFSRTDGLLMPEHNQIGLSLNNPFYITSKSSTIPEMKTTAGTSRTFQQCEPIYDHAHFQEASLISWNGIMTDVL